MQAADLTQFIENMLTILNIINNVLVFPTYCEYIQLKMHVNGRVRGIINSYLISVRKVFFIYFPQNWKIDVSSDG